MVVDQHHDVQEWIEERQQRFIAVADEIASAAELATGKVDRTPFVIVRGYGYQPGVGSGSELIMPAENDLFR